MDEIATALAETDTDDRRRIYLAWCRLGACRREIVPRVAAAFAATKHARGRESHVYFVTPYALFDDATVELGLRALADPRKEVRYRACGLLAHSRRKEVARDLRALATGPSREAARRAERALLDGTPFGADDDAYYFIYENDPARAPRGTFADALHDRVGGWLTARGLAPSQVFQHVVEYRDRARVVRIEWDSYDVEARVSIDARGERSAEAIRGGPNDVDDVVATVRHMLA